MHNIAAIGCGYWVEVPFSNENLQMNTAEIYEYANPATLYLECWGKKN